MFTTFQAIPAPAGLFAPVESPLRVLRGKVRSPADPTDRRNLRSDHRRGSGPFPPLSYRPILKSCPDLLMEHAELTAKIISRGMKVHRALGPGFLESIYRHALAHELRCAELLVECERKIQVCYDGVIVGDFAADMLVERRVLIEIKAVRAIAPAHEVQLVHYLTATGTNIGLLLNFGAERLEFKRKTRIYRPPSAGQDERKETESHDLLGDK